MTDVGLCRRIKNKLQTSFVILHRCILKRGQLVLDACDLFLPDDPGPWVQTVLTSSSPRKPTAGQQGLAPASPYSITVTIVTLFLLT